MPYCPNCMNEVEYAPSSYAQCRHCFYPSSIINPHAYAPEGIIQPAYGYYVTPQYVPYGQYIPPPPLYSPPQPAWLGGYPVQQDQAPAPQVNAFVTCSLCGGSDRRGAVHVCLPDLPSPLRLNNGELQDLIGQHEKYIARYKDSGYWKTQKQVGLAQSKVGELKAELVLREKIKSAAQEKKDKFSHFPLPTDFDIAGARYLAYVMQLLSGHIKPPPGMRRLPRLEMPESMTVAVGSSTNGTGLHYALSGEQRAWKTDKLQPEIHALCGSVYGRFYEINTAYDIEQSIGKSSSYDPSRYAIRCCAEPKLWDGLSKKEKAPRYSGMTTLWVGTKANLYPLIPEETGIGSPMLPCPLCCKFAKDNL